MPEKYIWSDNSAELFQSALNSNTVKDMIDKFKSKTYTMYTKDTINEAANDLRNVIIKAADMSLKKRKKDNGTKRG
jgi:rRNA-processing protein FCF1